jgi:hypothetical protein
MPGASFEDRLKRLAGAVPDRTPAPAVAAANPAPSRAETAPRTALQRFDDGIALVRKAGQRPSESFLLRELAGKGVPIAPLCFWPPANVFLWGVMVLLIILGGTLSMTEWLFLSLDDERLNPEWFAAFRFGYAGVIVLSSVLAAIFAWLQRRIARRADLPDWSEV